MNKNKWSCAEKKSAGLSKTLFLSPAIIRGDALSVKKKMWIFGVLLTQNSAEFSRNHSSVPRKFSKKSTCRADEKVFRIHVLTLSENSSDLCWTTVCEGEGSRGWVGIGELYSECPEEHWKRTSNFPNCRKNIFFEFRTRSKIFNFFAKISLDL